MDTIIFVLEDYKKSGVLSERDISMLKEAADILKNGGLVAFPTETVYGLGGNALLSSASEAIYKAKGRPQDNPLIAHISSLDELYPLVRSVPGSALKLAEKYWPGPLTMIFEKSDAVPYETTGGLETVAVRMPSHPVAAELIRLTGLPIAAPSANLSGRPSPTKAEHCIEDLSGRVDAIVDGGSCEIGVESSIIDISGDEPVLLRPGAVTLEMFEDTLRTDIGLDKALKGPLSDGEKPKAPGMKYRHYAPKAPMTLVTGNSPDAFFRIIKDASDNNKKVMLLCTSELLCELKDIAGNAYSAEDETFFGNVKVLILGNRKEPEGIAAELFDALRKTDDENADQIIAEGIDEKLIGMAVMNRMKKAAGWKIENI